MARPKYPSDKQAQYMLRLPDGLRDRIKRYAERHGRSMNAEIVRVLEREYPPLVKIDDVAEDLLRMLHAIKPVDDSEPMRLLAYGLLETIEGIAAGRVTGVSEEAREKVAERYSDFLEFVHEYAAEKDASNLDDEEFETYERGFGTAKLVDLDDEDAKP